MKEYTDAWLKESGFPERLQQARKATGKTLEEAALEVGACATYLWRMEHGEFTPSIARVCELADLYGVSVDWLCGRHTDD